MRKLRQAGLARTCAVVLKHLALAAALALMPGSAEAQAFPCDGEALVTGRIRCLIDAAEAAGDPARCEATVDATARFHCLSLFAERSGETAPCARIAAIDGEVESFRDACITGVAVAEEAAEICAEARDPRLRDSCYLMLVVEKGLESELCRRIADPAVRQACAEAPPAK